MSADADRVGRAFARHYGTYDEHAVVQRAIAERLDALTGQYVGVRPVRRALEIGMGTGFLSRLLARRFPAAEWWFNDLVPEALSHVPSELPRAHLLPGDAEHVSFPSELDLIASASAIQWFDDLPRFFDKAFAALSNGALLALSSFAEGHFRELSLLTGSALAYPSAAELRSMAERAGFTVIRCETHQRILHFATLRDLLHHLRSTGVNGRSKAKINSRQQLDMLQELYRLSFAEGSGLDLPLHYEPLILVAYKPRSADLTRES